MKRKEIFKNVAIKEIVCDPELANKFYREKLNDPNKCIWINDVKWKEILKERKLILEEQQESVKIELILIERRLNDCNYR